MFAITDMTEITAVLDRRRISELARPQLKLGDQFRPPLDAAAGLRRGEDERRGGDRCAGAELCDDDHTLAALLFVVPTPMLSPLLRSSLPGHLHQSPLAAPLAA